MPTMPKIMNEYLTLGKYLQNPDLLHIHSYFRAVYSHSSFGVNNCSYVELAKKSEPNKSFLAMTCSSVSDGKAA